MIQHFPRDVGWIEAIVGPMFSGKTGELIRRVKRAEIAQQKVCVFKPAIDVRYSEDEVESHDHERIPSITINSGAEIFDHLEDDVVVVGIDEVQFLDLDTVRVVRQLAHEGRRVIVGGLDQDYRGEPYETVMNLMVEAEYVSKYHAICVRCGNPAHRNQRLTSEGQRVVLGGSDKYEARCRRCFSPVRATETPLFFED